MVIRSAPQERLEKSAWVRIPLPAFLNVSVFNGKLYSIYLEMLAYDIDSIKNKYDSYNDMKNEHLNNIKQIIIDSNGLLEGNYFYEHLSLNLQDDKIAKQLNIFWAGAQATSKICEIGFNAGHSTMLMLLGRSSASLDFTIFDIGHHPYTMPSFKYISSCFPHVNFNFVKGDSTVTMPNWISKNESQRGTYDLIHVDGGHSEHCIRNDMINADILVKVDGLIVIDDTNQTHINGCVDAYLSTMKYKELHILMPHTYRHRIIQKISQ